MNFLSADAAVAMIEDDAVVGLVGGVADWSKPVHFMRRLSAAF